MCLFEYDYKCLNNIDNKCNTWHTARIPYTYVRDVDR